MDVQLANLVFAATNNTSISEEIVKYLCVFGVVVFKEDRTRKHPMLLLSLSYPCPPFILSRMASFHYDFLKMTPIFSSFILSFLSCHRHSFALFCCTANNMASVVRV